MRKNGRMLRLRSTDIPTDLITQLVQRIEGLTESPKRDYLLSQILSKYVSEDTDSPQIRRERAITKWLATEDRNEATNERLLDTHEEYQILPRVAFGSFVEWCQDTLLDMLGEIVPEEALFGAFSGGASTSRSRTVSQPAHKYVGKAHVTAEALDLFMDAYMSMPSWCNAQNSFFHPLVIETVPGNELFTVPKKTDIDRVCCKEPDLNMFLQKGAGKLIRRALRRVGINLNRQENNRLLAYRGSLDGSLATLDLSSASDSLSTNLARLLLPMHWYIHLDTLRSKVTIIDGVEHRNHMFSSMGNGFTFELESLLFYVITRAVAHFTKTPGVVSIYGDDIICPAEIAQDVSWVLQHFGFATNMEKSFWEGPFRESCGGHYWNGLDITPFYIREPVKTLPDLIHLANSVRKWSEEGINVLGYDLLDPEVEEIWFWLKGLVPNELWGGVDTSFKYQLVSHDTPAYRLFEEKKSKLVGHNGGYIHWLNATWERDGDDQCHLVDGISTSRYSESTERLKLKTARTSTVARLTTYFPRELG